MVEHTGASDADCIDSDRGFLPRSPPLRSFGADAAPFLEALDELERELPDLLKRDALGPKLRDLEAPPDGLFDDLTERELARVYRITGFLANAHVNGDGTAAIPAGVAVPLYESTDRLGRTPVLSYDAYVLHNWTLDDPARGVTPHNVRTLTNFVPDRDERWFVAVHVAIEADAGPAVGAIPDVQRGVREDDPEAVLGGLRRMEEALHGVVATLDRMPEHNDPETYNLSFRPYLTPLDGVTYEGVPELDGEVSYRGASGAQTSLFAALDAALGIDHGDNPLVDHLRDLREDMPPSHRSFVETVEAGPDLRDYVARTDDDLLVEAYNECIDRMVTFRERHVDIVRKYLARPTDETTGTGGTPYGRYLEAFTRDTRRRRL